MAAKVHAIPPGPGLPTDDPDRVSPGAADPDAPTTSQIKSTIDARHIGTPVSTSDLGLASLGTCEEAGGNPATPQERRMAAKGEAAISAVKAKEEGKREADRSKLYVWAGGAAAALVIVLGGFGYYLLGI